MNTKHIKLAAIGMLALGLSACSGDFLDVESVTTTTSQNFYKTQGDATHALYGCYDGWQRTVSEGPEFTIYQLVETMSDDCFGGTGNNDARNTQIIDRFDINESPSYTSLVENLWKRYYAAIYRCNEYIDHEDGIAWTDESLKNVYSGEVHAIRALCYFDMLRLWENVPLLTHATKELVPQAAPDSVYALVISDLKNAVANIPASQYPKADAANNDGHITKFAAEAMLARVYLFYNGYYGKEPENLSKAEALAYCEDVIASGEFGLVKRFRDLWPASSEDKTNGYVGEWVENSTYAGRGNEETVLAMKYNYTDDYNGNEDGNSFQVMVGLRTGAVAYDRYGQGWGGCTVNTRLVSAYSAGDQRRTASIIDVASELADYEDNYLGDQREYTGYFTKKYTVLSKNDADAGLTHYTTGIGAGDFQISQFQDWVLIRYADVLLMAAELGSPKAQDYFNQVRRRAFTEDDGTLSGYYREISASTANILNERHLEFAFEGLRYWDLLRQGVDVAAQTIAESGVKVLDGGVETTITINAQNIIAKRGFFQIPGNQISASNGTLKQNAGW